MGSLSSSSAARGRWIVAAGDQRCRRIARILETDGEDALDAAADEHLSTCLRCQAARARLRRAESWSSHHVSTDPPDGLLDEILAGIDAQGRRRRRTEVAAMVAATAGAIYLGRRALPL